MINVLCSVGLSLRSEVCLWTLLGLVRTIFDATLFRVNANLKQVWQMCLPEELSVAVQRALRTLVSGVMLVQCFTVYVYLASYIVLLYPVFLEERPTLVLPWLLMAAIRKLLCELASLALGLGTCVLLGAARPACVRFLVLKVATITPAFYMWMLVFSYYKSLKVASMFNKMPAVLENGEDYGLELAIRRRKTKSLLGEHELRSKIIASLYGEQNGESTVHPNATNPGVSSSSRMIHGSETSAADGNETDIFCPSSNPNCVSEPASYEDWLGTDVVLPRGCDRILEQFVLMLLRIKVHLEKVNLETTKQALAINTSIASSDSFNNNITSTSLGADDVNAAQVGSSRIAKRKSYIQEYPQIFMKRQEGSRNDSNVEAKINIETSYEADDKNNTSKTEKRTVTISTNEKIVSPNKQNIDTEKQEEFNVSKHTEGPGRAKKIVNKSIEVINSSRKIERHIADERLNINAVETQGNVSRENSDDENHETKQNSENFVDKRNDCDSSANEKRGKDELKQ